MKCPECNEEVSTNGVGPSGSPKFSWWLQKVYSNSCKLFHEAGVLHDFHYHIYEYGKTRADTEFLVDMLRIAKARPWYSRGWYKYQARKFYTAVKYGGDSSYEEAQGVCLRALNLNSRSIR
jgi:hypothetical protein